MSLALSLFAVTLVGPPGQVTPEQFLLQAKENLCSNFLREPNVQAALKYTWRCEVVTNTLNKKGELLKTSPYQVYEKYRTPQGIKARLTVHPRSYERKPVRVLEPAVRGFVPCSPCYFFCREHGRSVRDFVWRLTNVTFVERQTLDGRATMVYSFRTAPKIPKEYKASRNLKYAIGTEGTLWIDELDTGGQE